MSSDLAYESLTTVSDLIRRKQRSSVEVTNAILQRIAELDGQYHAYATVLAERALNQAIHLFDMTAVECDEDCIFVGEVLVK